MHSITTDNFHGKHRLPEAQRQEYNDGIVHNLSSRDAYLVPSSFLHLPPRSQHLK